MNAKLASKPMWRPVAFVTAWKAISIALTGAFGILGLLTEFKDKDRKKITKWGYISLVGSIELPWNYRSKRTI